MFTSNAIVFAALYNDIRTRYGRINQLSPHILTIHTTRTLSPDDSSTMATMISLEDYFVSSAMTKPTPAMYFDYFDADLDNRLRDVGPLRLHAMDEGFVTLQIVSVAPLDMPLSICQQTNDELAEHIAQAHGRLAGFAALPIGDPKAATTELTRCIKDLKLMEL